MPCDDHMIQEHTSRLAMMEATLHGLAEALAETRQQDLKNLESRLNAMFQNGPINKAQTAIAILQLEVASVRETTDAVRTMVERGFDRLASDFQKHIDLCPTRQHPKVSEVAKGSRWRYLPIWAYVLLGAMLVLGSDFLKSAGTKLVELIITKALAP